MIPSPKTIDHIQWVDELLTQEPHLLEKIQASQSVDPQAARELLLEVMRFLHLIAFYNRRLTPSLPVDLAWHEFILFTRMYADFCQEKCSRFIHHHPGGKESDNQRDFQKTLQLYMLHWGQPNEDIWGHLATTLFEEAQCGSCLGQS
ncbi:MAG: hypothetical protein AAF223_05325 [Bacteroidota bacterium]